MARLSRRVFTDDMSDNEQAMTTLVLGSTGKTGRRVADRLTALGWPVRHGSRSGRPPFDWEDRATWGPAVQGVDRVYVSYYPDLAVPGAVETIASFAALAVESGVERLVLLSGRGEESAEQAEQAVQASGAEWTILRSTWFNQNFSENFLVDAVITGVVALPVGDVGEPFVDADDIADAAVAALTEDGHAGQRYELTGPRLLTFGAAVAEIGAAVGRDIRYVSVSVDEYAAALGELDLPAEYTSLLIYLFTEVLDGRNAHLADGVQRALGREPRDFADFARAAAAAGVWDAGRSGPVRGEHDHADADETDGRPPEVVAVGPEPVDRHAPRQRADHEDAAIGGQHPTEVWVGLQRGDKAVGAEGEDPGADTGDAAVFAHALPDQPRPADLGQGGEHEQDDRTDHGHGRDPSVLEACFGEKCWVIGNFCV